ncbi:MAG TPA: L-fucokinase [Vicinamibacteria bacterium]|nr:L-fucokinase [Vicinamibacteria bacterium]
MAHPRPAIGAAHAGQFIAGWYRSEGARVVSSRPVPAIDAGQGLVMRLFDTVLITASSERQARSFRALVERRREHGLYPRELAFEVVADPPAGRVGTGGGTLWALERLLEARGAENRAAFFEGQRILLVHAGGESRRLPAYAPEGKLFAPLPLASSALLPPVVLDAQLGLFLQYPWRKGEIVVATGDVVIDFDTSGVPEERGPVFGFAKPASFEQGSRHGVFRFDAHRERVVDYLQKAASDVLARSARIEGTGECALDIGLVSLAPEAALAFLELGRTRLETGTLEDGLSRGALRFDLYLEVLTACLPGLSFDAFWERVRPASALSRDLARRVYDVFHPFGLGGTVTRSTFFEHVGSLAELPAACRGVLARSIVPFYEPEGGEIHPYEAPDRILNDCVDVDVAVSGPSPVLVDACRSCSLVLAGDNLVAGLDDLALPFELPRGFVLDGRRLEEGRVVVVLSAGDSLKAGVERLVFCGRPLDEWLAERGLAREDVFDGGEGTDLLAARLFCVDPTPDLLRGYVERPDGAWKSAFRAARRIALAEIQEKDDAVRREDRRVALRREVLREHFRLGHGWRAVSARDFEAAFSGEDDRPLLQAWLGRTDDALLRAYRERVYRQIAPAAGAAPSLPEIEYVSRGPGRPSLRPALKEDQIVWARAPVRLDLAGGWTDTPPYTLRRGGRVVNLAVNLNGQPPIQVFCRRTSERHVRVHSIDLGRTETFTRFEELLDYRDPVSAFALPKAALVLMGLDDATARTTALPDVLDSQGGGLEITLLSAVPKGSGLGTSSVLAGVILAALARFFGRPLVSDELIRQVLQVEQMLTTGGGWQDQIGGLVAGVKCIESRPGLRPHPVVHQLDPFLFQDPGRLACCTLFYTGITRLAKNILAEVVDQVNGSSKAYLFTLRHMAQLALDAKSAIERRDLDGLAEVVALSWEANKRVHPSTTNDEVEDILCATRPYFRGAKLLGAGGGGYALFLSSGRREAEAIRDVLRRQFEDRRARLVDFSLSGCGLEVSVS